MYRKYDYWACGLYGGDGLEADSKDVVSLAEGLPMEVLRIIRADLWEEFRSTVSLFYPHDLISNT